MLIVPVHNKLIVPNADIYFRLDQFTALAGKPAEGDRVTILVTRREERRDRLDQDSFYPVGCYGVVREISEDQGIVMVRTGKRLQVDAVSVDEDHAITLTLSPRADLEDLEPAEAAGKLAAMKQAARRMARSYEGGGTWAAYLDQMENVGQIGVLLSQWMKTSNEERYAVLAEDSVKRRTEMLEKLIYEFLEVTRVTGDALSAQQKENQEIYRESAIKKQMEYLQRELDEMHPEQVSDLRRLEKKVAESGMNETARKEADKVLGRLKQEGKHSPEAGLLYDYLDFLTGLSWGKEDFRPIDLARAREILDQDHYGLQKVKRRVIQQIAVMNLKKAQSGSILLFVGPPGTGKTSIGRSIARALDRAYVRVSLGGVRDEADIRGHRRTYIGAMPGRIMDGIQKSGVSNPVMVLDEVDKLASSFQGDPASALLEVLDPEQNNTFTDHYMNVPYDLSDVLFVCTANTTDTIPQPLLDRMEIIPFEGYTPAEKLSIAREHLLPAAMENTGIEPAQLSVPDGVIRTVISDYTREAGVRGLRKRLETLCRNAAVEIAQTPDRTHTVTEESVREDLDMRPVRHPRVPEEQKPGVVTGLAWTQLGGEILFIETLLTRGSGKLILTGKLGEVMKESARIAVSLVKSMLPDKARLFEENDLHIHVPEGAVPKDGPSAGVTMTTAIASLVTGRPVPPEIAMTGEVSLRGTVSAIGGLPEKLLAAREAGVRTVLIPRENLEDLRDVSREILEDLEVLPADRVSDVLARTGVLPMVMESAG